MNRAIAFAALAVALYLHIEAWIVLIDTGHMDEGAFALSLALWLGAGVVRDKEHKQ